MACDCWSLCKALSQQPGNVGACRQPLGFPEPEDSHPSISFLFPLSTTSFPDRATWIYCPAVGCQQQGWQQRGPTHAASRGCGRAQHPAPNLAWAPPDTPHPWPPHLQPLPAGCLHGCCHLVGCIPSLFFWPSAGAYSPQLLAGTAWQGGRCWAVLLLRFISGQSPSVRVGGGSHALDYCLCTTLCPVFTLSCSGRGVSPWKSTFGEVATWACAMLGASRRVGAQTSSHGQGALDQAG